MRVNELAKLAGVTVRTLHYYDSIGLLKPDKVAENGYRQYGAEAFEKLQQILFFRELEFPLSDIKLIIDSGCCERRDIMKKQREILVNKKKKMEELINALDNAINKGEEIDLKVFDKSELIELKEKYAAEVRERWGNTEAYRESLKRPVNDESQYISMVDGAYEIIGRFSEMLDMEMEPECEEVQKLVALWKNYISEHYYKCTDEILFGLGQMYVGDERFMKNIDRSGIGTAEFMSKAISYYCERGKADKENKE